MYVVDTNVLIHAVNASSAQHVAARTWLHDALGGDDTVGLPWVSLLGFLRITTNPGIMPRPLSIGDALSVAGSWVDAPHLVMLEPGARHFALLGDLLAASGSAGNLTTDAHIAALAVETRSPVVTFDRDFQRFGVDVVVPGAGG